MKLLRRISIGHRFAVGGVLFTIALVLGIAIVSLRTDGAILRAQMDLRGKAMADYMAKTSIFYYRNYDLGALEGFVKDITRDPEVSFAVFYDDKKKPLTTSSVTPADAQDLLVYNTIIVDEAGTTMGTVSLGYKTDVLDESAYQMMRVMVICALFAILVAIAGIMLFVRRLIVRPLAAAVTIADQLASGDLTVRFDTGRDDEIGLLFIALERMRVSLATAVGTIRQSAESVASVSQQIAAGNANISSRTEQQSSSLQETAASMEQFTASVKQNSENAEQASHAAIEASKVATLGGASMKDVVATMQGISESANKIADIIGIIDNIAFQTNILALNAAVEAARAGEQGRGFAVVAAEVRSLAQRTSTSASEIKGLIQASVGRIADGTRIVEGAGQTIDEIVASIQRVTDLMHEIAAASRQQFTGIEQVNSAIAHMDRGTQENAGVVEQTAASAGNMTQVAGELTSAVSRFQLDRSEPLQESYPEIASRSPSSARPIPMKRGAVRQAMGPRSRTRALPSVA